MKDNRGFSLVEIVVAIAIIAVVASASALTINLVTRANVEKGMQIVETTMGKLQTECTSKSKPTYMYIYQDPSDDDYYMKVCKNLHTSVASIVSDSAESEMIEANSVGMFYVTELAEGGVSAGSHKIENSSFLAVTYNKSDSSIVGYANGTKKFGTLIRIEANGSKKKAMIDIAYETGKVTYNSENQ